VLDFGSGAGLPGIPIQIARPELRVTLAESQKKKAVFLREVIRELSLIHATVHSGRVEDLPPAQSFNLVTLRAVDKMAEALPAAFSRMHSPRGGHTGRCMILTACPEVADIQSAADRWAGSQLSATSAILWQPPEVIPGTRRRVLLLGTRIC
jgi:16S rRNA (guanine527-N7)-methyltransferase